MGEVYLVARNGYVGNSLNWWREGGHGYTTDIDEAERFTLESAQRIIADHPSYSFWPLDTIEKVATRHVDMQNLRRNEK
jgi:hypothetical protein